MLEQQSLKTFNLSREGVVWPTCDIIMCISHDANMNKQQQNAAKGSVKGSLNFSIK